MKIIKEKILELEKLVEQNPLRLPTKAVADFLDINEEGLKAALMRGNAPFGFAYQRADGAYRVMVIPTVKFYLWFMNTTGQQVMKGE